MQKFFDCHVHSYHSQDSKLTFEQILAAAERENLAGIIITDHYDPYDLKHGKWVPSQFSDAEYYYDSLEHLQRNYQGRVRVLKGIEVGYLPETVDKFDEVIERFNWDCVLGAIHLVDGNYLREDFFSSRSRSYAYQRYIELMVRMVEDYGKFHVAAHFDMPGTRSTYEKPKMLYKDCPDLFDALLRAIISRGIALEVNTKSIWQVEESGEECGIDKEVLYRYRELGGELVTLGSDSHGKPGRDWDYAGHRFHETAQLLKDCGFSFVVHFERGKATRTVI